MVFINETKNKEIVSETNENRILSQNPLRSSNNQASLGVLFNDRKYYRDFLFKKNNFVFEEQNLIDMWDGRNYFYGKLSPLGYPIYCPRQSLGQIKNVENKSTIFAFNFVASAFDDMCDFVAKSASKPKHRMIKSVDSLYYPLTATSGWKDAKEFFRSSIESIYAAFTISYLPQHLDRKKIVLNFDHFMEEFVIFYRDFVKGSASALFSTITKSQLCPRHASGLIIDVQSEDSSDDQIKYESYISDPNFEAFRKIAQTYGFMVDKNIPWRLIANVRHSYMIKKQRQFGLLTKTNDLRELFSVGLAKAHREDVPLLRFHLSGFYQTFINQNPQEKIFLAKPCQGPAGLQHTKMVDRESIDAFNADGSFKLDAAFVKEYDDAYWLKIYYLLKSIDEKQKIDLKRLDKQYKNYYFMYKQRGLINTIDKIYKDLDTHAE